MKLDITIPENINEITLRQYQEFDKLNIENESILRLKMIEIFCNVDEVIVRNMKASDIVEICNGINQMFDINHNLINRFELNGVEYGFIPVLDDMTYGEYVDLDTYIGDVQELHKAMNVLYRPVILKQRGKYLIDEYKPDTFNNMLDMPLGVALGSMVFFWNLGTELSEVTINSLVKENKGNILQSLNLDKDGDGTRLSMDSLRAILQDLKISLN
jgi:hypothetical protein